MMEKIFLNFTSMIKKEFCYMPVFVLFCVVWLQRNSGTLNHRYGYESYDLDRVMQFFKNLGHGHEKNMSIKIYIIFIQE